MDWIGFLGRRICLDFDLSRNPNITMADVLTRWALSRNPNIMLFWKSMQNSSAPSLSRMNSGKSNSANAVEKTLSTNNRWISDGLKVLNTVNYCGILF